MFLKLAKGTWKLFNLVNKMYFEQNSRRFPMKRSYSLPSFYTIALSLMLLISSAPRAHGEILAMLNYEAKPEQLLRKEGIAIIDVDPNSPTFSKMLMDIPLPPDLVAHHIFYNKDLSKAYVTALGKSILHVMDMTQFPYRMKTVATPKCKVQEDIVFSEDNQTWYLTCMGSSNVVVGDATTDKPIKTIETPPSGTPFIRYPHGIDLHEGIDRLLVTSTIRPSDLGDPGETITVIEASTGKILSNPKVSMKPSPSGAAPVEAIFIPNTDPPVAYINNMNEGTTWSATWDPSKKDFDFRQVIDFTPLGQSVPLEIYPNHRGDQLFITTAKPGYLNIFDTSDPQAPKLLQAIPTAPGAHHVAFSPDQHYAFVQNSFINLPGMRDGSITVVDLTKGKAIAQIDTLKNQGFNPNCIVLLPEWITSEHSH
jgi:DNA-binding beta-propeller fold protein YncE